MSDVVRTIAALASEQIDDEGRQWIEVMPTGEKLRNGQWYFSIERADLEVFAESIRSGGDRTPVDYDHSYAEGKGTRAAGWFTGQAEVRDGADGPRLWAEVQWTAVAAEQIRNRQYRFVSPEFSFLERDAKSGLMTKAKALLAATLTNRPFFRGLAPVTASERVLAIERAREQFTSGEEPWAVTASEEELELHVRAEEILAAEGRWAGSYSDDEYIDAYGRAQAEAGVRP